MIRVRVRIPNCLSLPASRRATLEMFGLHFAFGRGGTEGFGLAAPVLLAWSRHDPSPAFLEPSRGTGLVHSHPMGQCHMQGLGTAVGSQQLPSAPESGC